MRWTVSLLALLSLAALGETPKGWDYVSPTPTSYQSLVDRVVFHQGRASGALKSVDTVGRRHYALLTRQLGALPYRGWKVRLSGYLRTEGVNGWAGLWLRVDSATGPLKFDNMQDRPIQGTTPWTRYAIELEVPAESREIHLGVLLSGQGQVWVDEVLLECLEPAVPGNQERQKARSLDPVRFDFEDP